MPVASFVVAAMLSSMSSVPPKAADHLSRVLLPRAAARLFVGTRDLGRVARRSHWVFFWLAEPRCCARRLEVRGRSDDDRGQGCASATLLARGGSEVPSNVPVMETPYTAKTDEATVPNDTSAQSRWAVARAVVAADTRGEHGGRECDNRIMFERAQRGSKSSFHCIETKLVNVKFICRMISPTSQAISAWRRWPTAQRDSSRRRRPSARSTANDLSALGARDLFDGAIAFFLCLLRVPISLARWTTPNGY